MNKEIYTKLVMEIYKKLDDGTMHTIICNGDHRARVGAPGLICNCTLGQEIKTLRNRAEKAEAQILTMNRPVYTDKPPTVPGLYWYRLGGSQADRFCRVWEQNGQLLTTAGDGVKSVTLFKRNWAGPLPEPER